MLETRQLPAAKDADDIAERLRASRAPALVVAPVEARLVATNAAGARALGMAATTQPENGFSLDSAMPAIMQLRRLAGLPDVSLHGVVEPLVFWTPGGAARFLCRVRTLDDTLGRHLMLVEPLDHDAAPADCAGSSGVSIDTIGDAVAATQTPGDGAGEDDASDADGPEADAALMPAAPTPPPPPVRDDAEILRAIARQILGGGTPAPRPAKLPARNRPRPAARDVAELGGEALAPALAFAASTSAGSGCGRVGADESAGRADGEDDGASNPQRASHEERATSQTTEPRAADGPLTPQPVAPARPAPSSRRALARRIAHELKSPLSAIAAAAEIMKDERLGPIGDERYLRYARDIHESARHALDVVQRMLGAEIEAATSPQLEFTDLDLNAVVAALVSAMEPVAAEAGVRLSASLGAHLPRVVADGTSVRQMALNLLTNAIKFTPRGGEVRVSTIAEVDGPLTFEVTDTGPGMSASEIARVEAVDSTDQQAPRKGGGLGIGLPLVRSLAAANGASLALSTRSPGGTVAAIVFPKTRQVLV